MKSAKASKRPVPRALHTAISLLCGTAPLLATQSFAADAAAGAVEEIIVSDRMPNRYTLEQSSLSKLTESLQDTPQSIAVITGQLMEDRAVMSLTDALRNVPGITLGAGEFSWQGNNPNIRGFNSRNDMFLDGMRDFGNYDRDPFNLENIEVLQGPSSMVFGRGSTGGVINQVSKRPEDEQLRSIHVNVGNADTRRVVVDLNEPLSDSVAARINVMKHDSDVPERDGAAADRFGIAPSLSMELGSATDLTLFYMKQKSSNVPDYGLPWLAGSPADVERSSFYGFDSDFVDTDADITTAQLEHQLNTNNRVQALVRYADYARSTRITEPLLVGAPTATTPLDTVLVNRNVFRGESNERTFMTQLNIVSAFSTWGIEHALVTGIETARENSSPGFGFALNVPTTPLLNPGGSFSSTGVAWRVLSESTADSLAAFALDTLKFDEQWQLVAGIRRDRFAVDYQADRFNDNGTFNRAERIERTDIKTSYRAALVYKPVDSGTLYLGWGTSFNPSAEGLSFINSGRALTVGDSRLDPENNRTGPAVKRGSQGKISMSTLVLELRQGDLMVVNGAPIRFRNRARIELAARARFLFGKQIMAPDAADTPARRIYFALQTAYIGNDEERGGGLETARTLITEFQDATTSEQARGLLGEALALAERDECYAALKLARRIMRHEEEVLGLPPHPLTRVEPSRAPAPPIVEHRRSEPRPSLNGPLRRAEPALAGPPVQDR